MKNIELYPEMNEQIVDLLEMTGSLPDLYAAALIREYQKYGTPEEVRNQKNELESVRGMIERVKEISRQQDKPLTPEELISRHGKPVWCVDGCGREHWCLVSSKKDWHRIIGEHGEMNFDFYGKTGDGKNGLNMDGWIAYDRELTGRKDKPIVEIPETEIGDLSDGYHTFNELYHHRAVLFSVICNLHTLCSWKAKKHHDGTMYDGMFIVGINTPSGQATYHYDIEPYWDMFKVPETEYAPEWDGHTAKDAIDRIRLLGKEIEPITNYDKIMQDMTPERLTELLTERFYIPCKAIEHTGECKTNIKCKECISEYLQQEVKEDVD